jgi:asparagine synthase (glutamine-hydrolysing)
MPGIVGVVAPERREMLEGRVEDMLRRMRARPAYGSARRIREGCALALLGMDAETAFAESNHLVLTFQGEFYDEALSPAPDAPEPSLAERLLARYREGGAAALGGLNGLYTVVVWDARERQLTVVTDRSGFRKLHYYAAGGLLLLGTEYKSFLGQDGFNGVLDEAGIVEFMSLGYCLDDRTFFRDVKLAPPGSILTFRKGALRVEPYWDYRFGEDGGPRHEDDAIDGFAERLKTAVTRRARPGMCVQISGGLDSRALLGMVGRHCPGLPVRTVTVGDARCHDVRFGRQLAKTYGYEHTLVPVPPNFYEAFGETGIERTEGSISAINFFIFAMDPYLEASETPAVMNGFLGDSLTGGHLFPEALDAPDDDTAFDRLYGRFYGSVVGDEGLRRLFQSDISRDLLGEPYRAVRRCFDRRPDLRRENRSDYVDLHQRQRRFAASHIEFLSPLATVLDPFADNEVVDFLLSLPVELRRGQRAYREMIRRHLPEAARVPQAGTGLPLTASWSREKWLRARMRFYYRMLPRLTLGKYGGKNLSSPVRHDVACGGRRATLSPRCWPAGTCWRTFSTWTRWPG